ncbi:class I SAM-dependent methyltransferase [Phytoactinopolyspora alkaliphila]|uniref:Class I SAM-dependent methyltransferase n=1 Tax=Phytoactinopolyspora alkaliphila TaxID=1783498 RepID=A0A6N9YI32_9ACTN|nr:class I SAM-dependent methyltransferase [Phytoactinopolyspora alkaliphila]NED94580.1 class I SAM-dependent methyltransferase [Phytoactinopolyspora alkaliphila]
MHRDVIPSPNIWQSPDIYEIENLGVDPEGVIEDAMRRVHDWRGQSVLDVGCGAGFHLPRFAAEAARVIGVEPHPPLVRRARRRIAALNGSPGRVRGLLSAGQSADRVHVLRGTAQDLPLPSSSIDVAHARWAYFFGPGCEPGIAELARVVRRGGTAFVIDNDATRSTFGAWFRRALPSYDPQAVERFWARQGWHRIPLEIRWEHPDRETFESVVRIEFEPKIADAFLAEHPGSSVDYAVNLFWHTF